MFFDFSRSVIEEKSFSMTFFEITQLFNDFFKTRRPFYLEYDTLLRYSSKWTSYGNHAMK